MGEERASGLRFVAWGAADPRALCVGMKRGLRASGVGAALVVSMAERDGRMRTEEKKKKEG